MDEPVLTQSAPRPVGAYPHARRAGPLLFLSGIGPRSAIDNSIPGNQYDPDGRLVGYDIEAQCRSVFANVDAVLAAAGVSRDQLVDITVFLTDMSADFATMNRLYAEHFGSVQACRTTVQVSALPTPIAIELKCIAALG
jgi:2-aminomuconate deaminase